MEEDERSWEGRGAVLCGGENEGREVEVGIEEFWSWQRYWCVALDKKKKLEGESNPEHKEIYSRHQQKNVEQT